MRFDNPRRQNCPRILTLTTTKKLTPQVLCAYTCTKSWDNDGVWKSVSWRSKRAFEQMSYYDASFLTRRRKLNKNNMFFATHQFCTLVLCFSNAKGPGNLAMLFKTIINPLKSLSRMFYPCLPHNTCTSNGTAVLFWSQTYMYMQLLCPTGKSNIYEVISSESTLYPIRTHETNNSIKVQNTE